METRRAFGGADVFMAVLDREIRRAGLSGFNSLAILRLATKPDVASLTVALAADTDFARAIRSSVLRTFPMRRFVRDVSRVVAPPRVDVLDAPPGGESEPWPSILNARLRPELGENVRFTVFPVPGDGWRVTFLFSHLLADAKAAERLLVQLSAGGSDAAWPDSRSLIGAAPFREVGALTRQHARAIVSESEGRLHTLGDASAAGGRECAGAVAVLSDSETAAAVAAGRKAAGYAMEGLWYLACVLAADRDTESRAPPAGARYSVPLPMSLDKKGETRAFGNNLVFVFLGAPVEEARDPAALAKRLRDRMMRHLKERGDRASQAQMEFGRHLPLFFHSHIARKSVGGEFGSLFFTNPGPVAAGLTSFFGAAVTDVSHFPIPAPDPGICAAVWTFGDRLHLGMTWLRSRFTDERARALLDRWRQRVGEAPR